MPSRFTDMTPEEQRRAAWFLNFAEWEEDRRLLLVREDGQPLTPQEEKSLGYIDWGLSDDEAVSLLHEAATLLREEGCE